MALPAACCLPLTVQGGHLLNHDDVIGTRAVSFIIYLTDPDEPWTAADGGALELYPLAEGAIRGKRGGGRARSHSPSMTNANMWPDLTRLVVWLCAAPPSTPPQTIQTQPTTHNPQPTTHAGKPHAPDVIPTTSHLPAWNSMALFVVQPGRSFHSVQEVVAPDKPRFSISGWFHQAAPQAGAAHASLQQLQMKAGEDQMQGHEAFEGACVLWCACVGVVGGVHLDIVGCSKRGTFVCVFLFVGRAGGASECHHLPTVKKSTTHGIHSGARRHV